MNNPIPKLLESTKNLKVGDIVGDSWNIRNNKPLDYHLFKITEIVDLQTIIVNGIRIDGKDLLEERVYNFHMGISGFYLHGPAKVKERNHLLTNMFKIN